MAFTFKHGDRPIAGYEIQRGLGRGAFGEVYYAVSDGGREVALKYLHSNRDVELRGISHCINMKSPNLVSVFDVVRNDEGDCFVIMEHISGPSLRDLMIREPRGLGVGKATFFLREIARGLQYLHDRGVVHRDLKPGNIFYEEGYVKIGDYGLSKFISQSVASGNTQSVGTLHYMAPEVGTGNYTKCIDIYALGVIIYEMLVGKVPFEGQSAGEVLMKHLMNQPEVDELSDPFPRVIRRALAKDPNDRYQEVKDMVEDVLGPGRFERIDTDSLTPVAAFAARNLRSEAPTMPVPSAPDHRDFEGSSAVGVRRHPGPELHADRLPRAMRAGMPPRVRYAGFWIRLLAILVDGVVLFPVVFLVGGPFPFGFVAKTAYAVLLLTMWDGQTVGKRTCGIRVVCADGQPVNFAQALTREISKLLSGFVLCIGYIMAGFTARKQALHDMVASTCVVYNEPQAPWRPEPERRWDAGRARWVEPARHERRRVPENVR